MFKTLMAIMVSQLMLSNHVCAHIENDDFVLKYLNNSNISNIHTGRYEIVLTIDDGPTYGVTDKILNSLRKYGVEATFFVVGQRVPSKEALVARMVREGHIVANHTYTHPTSRQWRFFNNTQKQSEFTRAHNVISKYTYNSDYLYFRAPGGYWNRDLANLANSTPFARKLKGPILWDIGGTKPTRNSAGRYVLAADWACWSGNSRVSVSQCLEGYINETVKKKGGVVLFHDLKVQSAQLIDRYVKYFVDKGYRFISMNDVNL